MIRRDRHIPGAGNSGLDLRFSNRLSLQTLGHHRWVNLFKVGER